MKILEGKKALILGVANERSIAWGIAKSFEKHGCKIGLSYLNEKMKTRVDPLAESINADFTFELDVTNDDHLNSMNEKIKKHWENVDIVVHSMAFADREDLKGNFVNTSKSGFLMAMNVSAYSLISITNKLLPILNENSSIISMTYHGSQKVVENYNVMGVAKAALEASTRYLAYDLGEKGIRVNCISAGPVRTLAASGISGFRSILKTVEEKAPLKSNIDTEDVGGSALYLASDLSKKVTGQVIYVDSGLSIMGI